MNLSNQPTSAKFDRAGRRASHVESPEANCLAETQKPAFNGADSMTLYGSHVSPRTGRRVLDELRSDLSARDLAVTSSVANFRYLTAAHIEALYFHGHASKTTAGRKARATLDRLTSHRILQRLERRVGGIRAGSASYVYYLGPVGHRLLAEAGARPRYKEPSLYFLKHTLAIADLAVQLTVSGRERQYEPAAHSDDDQRDDEEDRVVATRVRSVVTEPDCWRPFTSGIFGAKEVLKPDLSVVTFDHEYDYHWFVELDLGTESGTAIRKKAAVYVAYLKTGVEQAEHGIVPRVLWVAPTAKRAEFLAASLEGVRGAPNGLFQTVEISHALEHMKGGQP
jgi:hypothetical protein